MPFVPLNPDEQKKWPGPCRSSEHYPPSHMVITHRMKWQCPACKHEIILEPPTVGMGCGPVPVQYLEQPSGMTFVSDEPARLNAYYLKYMGSGYNLPQTYRDDKEHVPPGQRHGNSPKPRTRRQVMWERANAPGGAGCCDRYANRTGCDCLALAILEECDQCHGTGYTGDGPMNGWNKDTKRCPRGCPVNCRICSDPNCDNPNGQH